MDDMNRKAKEAVLKQIMEMMDEREISGLKTKSPKFAKPVESEDSEMADSIKDRVLGKTDESEKAEVEPVNTEDEESLDHNERMKPEDDMDDEDLEKLRALYERHK